MTATREASASSDAKASILRSELGRIAHRRFIQVLLALGCLGLLAAIAFSFTQFNRLTPATLAEAEVARDAAVRAEAQYRAQCLAQVPAGENPEMYCGPPVSADNLGPVEAFARPSFDFADAVVPGSIAVSTATAMIFFLVGATYVGADWASRTIVALLFWDPRRLTVVAVKAFTTALTALVVGVVAQVIWLAGAWALAAARGSMGGRPPDLADRLVSAQARGVLLVVLVSLLGFGLANLIRSTGAALGVGFVYFAVLENAVRGLRPGWSQWLFTENAAALLAPGGIELSSPPTGPGDSVSGVAPPMIGNLHGGLVLMGFVAAVIVASAVLFRRRDLS